MINRGFYRYKDILKSSNFCIYCGKDLCEWEKVIDHFLPFSIYESNSKENLFVACRECNSIKSDRIFINLYDARTYILPIKNEKGVKTEKITKKWNKIYRCLDCNFIIERPSNRNEYYCIECRAKSYENVSKNV